MAEYLVIDGENLTGPIKAKDLLPLRGAMYRGANLTMPTAAGSRPYPPMLDELDVSISFVITGFTEPDGTPFVDPLDGVDLNVEHYRTLFCDGPDPDTGTKDYTMILPSRTLGALVQCWDYSPVRNGPGSAIAVVRLVVYTGQMAPA